MNTVRIFFLTILSYFILVSVSNADHSVISGYTINDVHVWPDSKCDACHASARPDNDSARLIMDDVSRLCESCHKGTVTILPASKLRSTVKIMNNHPIKYSPLDFNPQKISHNIVRDGEYYYVSGESGKLPLSGDSRMSAVAECTTCHEPHGKSRRKELHRIDNSKGQLCLICHIDKAP